MSASEECTQKIEEHRYERAIRDKYIVVVDREGFQSKCDPGFERYSIAIKSYGYGGHPLMRFGNDHAVKVSADSLRQLKEMLTDMLKACDQQVFELVETETVLRPRK